jgi:threonine dehydrogenase-like Zn-dependent dehydrogenase
MARGYKILGGTVAVLALALTALGIYVSHDSACGSAPPLAAKALADNAALIKVHAASINPLDWHYMRGEPYVMRMDVGIGAPVNPRMGVDFAGTVEAVGKNVKRFKVGDEVFGAADGAFAEYVTVRENKSIALKPANASFEQASDRRHHGTAGAARQRQAAARSESADQRCIRWRGHLCRASG